MECQIRRWKEEDASHLASIISDPRVQEGIRDGIPNPYTEEDALEYIRSVSNADRNQVFSFAITAYGNVIGSISAFRLDNVNKFTAELGYYLAPSQWNKGLMTQAVNQLCSYVFNNSDLRRITAEVFSFNHASCRVLEKCGFHLDGILYDNVYKNGKMCDSVIYGMTKKGYEHRIMNNWHNDML